MRARRHDQRFRALIVDARHLGQLVDCKFGQIIARANRVLRKLRRKCSVHAVELEQILHDPAGTNPAEVDATATPFKARRGRHELLIALGTNGGRAWGLYLRLERTDKHRPLPKWID
jgi:hypothetical protein